jgi:DNA polymerase III subunit epsilon
MEAGKNFMDVGIIVDIETTGLDAKNDEIIEVGVLEFCIDEQQNPTITSMYCGLEDPQRELEPEISALTGISNQVVKNQKINWPLVRAYFERASVVIAHNAEFDASFLTKRQELQGASNHWACSIKHIDWSKRGFKSQKLVYLAADHGFANPFAHRALFDCATTFRLIAPHMQELIDRSWLRSFEVAAVNSPFETKDVLKKHGYYWDAAGRVWRKVILEDQLENERIFLKEQVYGQRQDAHTESELPGID